MVELTLISALIHRGGQKAMCDNDCGAAYNTQTKTIHANTNTHKLLADAAWVQVWTRCQNSLSVPW